jgi:hypothetical protein
MQNNIDQQKTADKERNITYQKRKDKNILRIGLQKT